VNTTLKVGLAISSFAISLSVFAHPTILAQPETLSQALAKVGKDGIVDVSKVKEMSFDFELTKNGKSITSAKAYVMSGETFKYGITDEIGYLKSASEKDGLVTLVPGKLSSGFWLEMKPVWQAGGNIALEYNATNTDLNSMDTVVTDGQPVQKPNISSYATKQSVQMVQGQTFQTQLTDLENAKDKYVLTIKANI
jgi:phosphoribosylformylglycinamidine (FGAM) synthase PurS component